MHALEGKRVLVVEDEPLIALVLADILSDAGCVVVGPAYDPEQALSWISSTPVDAAVLDVNLGAGQTSAPVADELQSMNIPYIFATGYSETALRVQDRDKLRVDKPFDSTKICDALRECLRKQPRRSTR